MNEIKLLFSLLREYGANKFLISDCPSEFLGVLDNLKEMGLWHDAGKDKKILCDKCECPHYAYLQRFPNGAYGWRCSDIGIHILDDSHSKRETGQLNIHKFIEFIRQSIGYKKDKNNFNTELNGLYDLGKLDNNHIEGDFFLYLQNQHPITDDYLYHFLKTRMRPHLGIIFCIYDNIETREYPLPMNYYVIPLCHAFEIENRKMNFHIENINQFLPDHKQIILHQNPVGRPTNQHNIQNIYNVLSKENSFLQKTVKEQAEIIHKEMGSPISPTKKTISNKIPQIKNAQNYAQNSNLG